MKISSHRIRLLVQFVFKILVGLQARETTVCFRCGLVWRKIFHRAVACPVVALPIALSLLYTPIPNFPIGFVRVRSVGSWYNSLFSLWPHESITPLLLRFWLSAKQLPCCSATLGRISCFLSFLRTAVYFLCGLVRSWGSWDNSLFSLWSREAVASLLLTKCEAITVLCVSLFRIAFPDIL